MAFDPPLELNVADYFLDARVCEGRGERTALFAPEGELRYRDVQALANRVGNALRALGVEQEHRVILALPDGAPYVGALFGILKIGAVAVMLNPQLAAEDAAFFCEYTRARAAIVGAEAREAFAAAARSARFLRHVLAAGDTLDAACARASDRLENASTHRDDAAIWLFSGGTTGRPKAVPQSHLSFANTTECYAKRTLGYRESDVTIAVPKLFFGYATGSNLFFPFAVGGASVLFAEKPTPEVLFEKIRRHRPTILVNVPTMVNRMVAHPDAARQDLSCLRFATSAGEALPAELYERWRASFGVELLDGLGTAEMWHIFLTNRPGEVRPGTLGRPVEGFEVKACDEGGREVPAGEVGELWVRGRSRAIGYWQQMERTAAAFRGEWFVGGDLVRRDADGYFRYCGRRDELLKVDGKWLAPQEVEGCLLEHPAVRDCAVVGVAGRDGLVKPRAFVVAPGGGPGLAAELREFVLARLEPYKHPREVVFVESLPRTHLGKVDRARLRAPGGGDPYPP
jgi:benzoate-CoA ligase family protein